MTTTHDRTKSLIAAAVIECMPEAAAASGLCSLVDLSPWVAEMSARFPIEARPELGLSVLVAFLEANGVAAGERAAKELRTAWVRDGLRAAVLAGQK